MDEATRNFLEATACAAIADVNALLTARQEWERQPTPFARGKFTNTKHLMRRAIARKVLRKLWAGEPLGEELLLLLFPE